MTALLEMKGLTKNYWLTEKQTDRTYLFSDITATVKSGERIALLGKSGQGKSTLLRILALLEQSDRGEIRLNGVTSRHTDTRVWRTIVTYVAQQATMLPGTIEENLKTVSKIHNETFDDKLARKLMKDVGLESIDWAKKATDLSGGEKQRVALVRSLLLKPSILLLDEVTASLDQQSKESVENLLLNWNAAYKTSFLWVTHDSEQARRISERIWFMEKGTLAADCETEIFFNNPTSLFNEVTT
ncbi:ATP-binding cassette domain-containing protein [Psychrobacillus sp. OK032]|uniref:ABC transporter ATP-binding protein n=1 Tax=Psychrobacillus sp. OK032 TaxID=1884358 RepID=UPI0008C4B5B9|nr:ATP-binding cassette domain-containing protein [Psychrobacillus sp. OK032]SES19355.1 putative ABC transport system ATP-binding protein [Psychrobacillus sp. OK032]